MYHNFRLEYKLKTARNYENQEKYLHAIQIYTQVIEEHPEFYEAHFYLSDIYENIGKINSAYNLLENLLMKNEGNNDIRLFFGQFLLRNGKWKEATEVLNIISPDEEPVVTFFIGYSYYMLKDYELAKHNFKGYIKLNDQEELVQEANIYLAKIEIELSNFESALDFAKKAELLYSNFWELHLIYAICYYNLGMYEHAVLPIEKAIKFNPKQANSYEWAGKIYLKNDEYLKAEKNFLKYIELNEFISSDAYSQLAEACLKAKKPEKAVDYYSLALKINPENKSAKEGMKNASLLLKNNMVSDG